MTLVTSAERVDRFEAELAATAKSADADHRLTAMLADPTLSLGERVYVAAELGNHRGPAGSAALRQAFSAALADMATASKHFRRLYCDLACASIAALARREGPAATDIYVTAASSPSMWVRGYGLSALARFGDHQAWEQILTRLSKLLQRKITPLRADETFWAIEYLARHAEQGSDRATRLITLLRDRWHQLAHDSMLAGGLERSWPGIQPGGPPAAELDLPSLHTPRFE